MIQPPMAIKIGLEKALHNDAQSNELAGVSRAGARTGLQLQGHGDMQGFNSPSPAFLGSLLSASALKQNADFQNPSQDHLPVWPNG